MRILLGYPTFLFLIVFFSAWLVLVRSHAAPRVLRLLCVGGGLLSVAVFLFLAALNLGRTSFIWHDEPHILTVAAAYLRGQPMYHTAGGKDFYALLYGPSTFLVYAPIIWRSAHPLAATRIAISLLAAVNLLLFYRILRVQLPRTLAVGLVPVGVAALLLQASSLFGARGDLWLLACLSLALLAATGSGWVAAALVSGVFCGLAVDFKITMAPLALLVFAILARRQGRDGRRAAALSAVAALAAALGPFLLPGISLGNYLVWLRFGSRQHLIGRQLVENIIVAAFLIGGAALVRLLGDKPLALRRDGLLVPLLGAAGLAGCILTGSKDGAGLWHLWPMLPFVLLWTGCEAATRLPAGALAGPAAGVGRSRTLAVVAAVAVAAALLTARYGFRADGLLREKSGAARRERELAAEAEIESLTRRFPGRNLAMGYGTLSDDDRVSLRFELPLRNQDVFFDLNAVSEGIKEGVPVPGSVVERIDGCEDIWLVPHGDGPFSTLRTRLLPIVDTPYVFPDSLRLGFPATHRLAESHPTYDVWMCNSARQGGESEVRTGNWRLGAKSPGL